MPRDLESEKTTLEGMQPLSKEPDMANSPPDDPLPLYRLPTYMIEDRFKKMKDLHPYSLLLSQEDIDDCDWLEHAAFEAFEAASREKLEYRLHVCGELCSGLYTSAYNTSPSPSGPLLHTRNFPSADSHDSDRKRVLLGHIIATKHSAPLVTDPSMDFPKDWRTNYQLTHTSTSKDGKKEEIGHNEIGETVCLHSLAVHPDFQGKGLASVLLKSWTQRIRDAGLAKRVALICRERFVGFYEKAGFKKIGESKCRYAGGGWVDMVCEFDDAGHDDEY